MVLRRFFARPEGGAVPAAPAAAAATEGQAETASVRKIASELEALPYDQARYLAGFAYVLSRAANADREITDEEIALMEQVVQQHGHLSEAQAVLVVEIARNQARLFGGTEDYLVTREFRAMATDGQKIDLLRCCFLVGAADESIDAHESALLDEIGSELGIEEDRVTAMRREFTDSFAAVQAARQVRAAGEADNPDGVS